MHTLCEITTTDGDTFTLFDDHGQMLLHYQRDRDSDKPCPVIDVSPDVLVALAAAATATPVSRKLH